MPSVTAATARARARLETVNKRLAVRPRGDQLTADITQHNTIDFRRHAAITPHNTTQLRTPAPRLSLPRPGASARQDTGHPGCSVVLWCSPALMMGRRAAAWAGAGAGLGLGNIECVSSAYSGAVVHRASTRTRRGLSKSLHTETGAAAEAGSSGDEMQILFCYCSA